jgi:hypothetical protein
MTRHPMQSIDGVRVVGYVPDYCFMRRYVAVDVFGLEPACADAKIARVVCEYQSWARFVWQEADVARFPNMIRDAVARRGQA